MQLLEQNLPVSPLLQKIWQNISIQLRRREFRADIPTYLATLGEGYPKTVEDLVERSMMLTAPTSEGFVPNPRRWSLFKEEEESGTLDDYEYRAVRDHGLPLIRAVVEGMMREDQLDAIVYPTAPRRPPRSDADPDPLADLFASATNIANLTGFPDLIELIAVWRRAHIWYHGRTMEARI